VVVEDLPEGHLEHVRASVISRAGPDSPSYSVPLSRVVYIEASDFRAKNDEDFYGLVPGGRIMLRYAHARSVRYVSHSVDPATGSASEVRVCSEEGSKKPPKGVLNWVAQPAPGVDPPRFEARLYEDLYLPKEGEGEGKLNPRSLEVLTGCFLNAATLEAAEAGETRFQFERLGYFFLDPDSTPGAPVFNRTVALRGAVKGG